MDDEAAEATRGPRVSPESTSWREEANCGFLKFSTSEVPLQFVRSRNEEESCCRFFFSFLFWRKHRIAMYKNSLGISKLLPVVILTSKLNFFFLISH